MDSLYDPNAVFHVFPFGDMDLEAQKQFIVAFSQAFPDFSVNRLEDIIQGDTTVHRWSASGTFTGKSPIMPVEPTGKQSYAEGTHILHWKDGKVIETFHYGDWLGWLIGCGVLPPLSVPA
jgi:predicted ester cyclase